MMVEMSDDVVGELLSAFFKLGALQLRLGIITTEAMLTFGGRANQTIGALDKAMPSAISEEEIEGRGQGYPSETDRWSRTRFSMPAAGELFGRRYWGYGPRRCGSRAPDRIGRAGDHRFRNCRHGAGSAAPLWAGSAPSLVKAATPDRAVGVGMALESRATVATIEFGLYVATKLAR